MCCFRGGINFKPHPQRRALVSPRGSDEYPRPFDIVVPLPGELPVTSHPGELAMLLAAS